MDRHCAHRRGDLGRGDQYRRRSVRWGGLRQAGREGDSTARDMYDLAYSPDGQGVGYGGCTDKLVINMTGVRSDGAAGAGAVLCFVELGHATG